MSAAGLAESDWTACPAARSRTLSRSVGQLGRSFAADGFSIPDFPRQALHSRSRRSFGENLAAFLASDDRPPRRSFQRTLPRHSSEAADTVRNEAARLPFHLLRLGRDGGVDPQPRRSRRPLLHVRRVLRQMARCRQTLRQEGRSRCRSNGASPSIQKDVDAKLATGEFDAVTLIHNETSTGVMNPLAGNLLQLAKYPDVVLIVDTVSSFSAVPIDDGCARHRRHAHRHPKGARACRPASRSSPRPKRPSRAPQQQRIAATTSTSSSSRSNKPNGMTPSTPSIGHIYALQSKLDEIFSEGLANRYARHARTNALVHDWVRKHGFDFFAEEGFRSKTLTCVKNNRRHRRRRNSRKICAKNITSSSTAATARSKARPSASPTWATKPKKPFRICWPVWTMS